MIIQNNIPVFISEKENQKQLEDFIIHLLLDIFNSIDTTKMSNLIGDIHMGMTVRNQNKQKVLMYFTTFKAKLANFTKKIP